MHRVVLSILAVVSLSVPAAEPSFTPMSTWRLPGTPTEVRWLEIHQIEGPLFHISVLSRVKGQPIWSLKHLTAHMAITEPALRRSVTGPAPKERFSYPEQYNEGYDHWQKLQAKGNAPICETSVLECAHLSP